MSLATWRQCLHKTADTCDNFTYHYNLILATMLCWGIYALFWHEAPTAVSQESSPIIYTVFVVLHVLAPIAIWIGELNRDPQVQWWLRWAGDAALCVILGTHFSSLFPHVESIGSVYLMFLLAALTMSALALSARDLIRALNASGWCRK